MLLVALGLDGAADLGAAAAVLFAVNVTAVLPVTPSNLGVFQAACVAVLTGAYGIDAAQALGYGIILQAVEIATAVVMGAPALVKEGLSWREVRLRALHTAPVSLAPRRRSGRGLSAGSAGRQFRQLRRRVGALMRRSLAFLALLVAARSSRPPPRPPRSATSTAPTCATSRTCRTPSTTAGRPTTAPTSSSRRWPGRSTRWRAPTRTACRSSTSRPRPREIVSTYDCGVTQGDVQVFRQADEPGRTFIGYASDTFGDGTSTCYREAQALGFDVLKADGTGKNGTFIADVTDPLHPKTVGFVEVAQGSHNQTIHPSGNFLYNSNSDLITSIEPAIEVFDISDPRRPEGRRRAGAPAAAGLGTESHDITFSDDGKRAYSAALSQGVIIDTRDPANPSIISSFLDPTINVWHQMDPFTITDASGREREFVIAEDEFAGALGTGQCPNGGVHVFETTGALERNPQKVGYWNIDTLGPTDQVDGRCTAHVFDIHEEAEDHDDRLLQRRRARGRPLRPDRHLARRPAGRRRRHEGDRLLPDPGHGHVGGQDARDRVRRQLLPVQQRHRRGLDVFRFRRRGRAAAAKNGTWMGAAQAAAFFAGLPKVRVTRANALVCMLPQQSLTPAPLRAPPPPPAACSVGAMDRGRPSSSPWPSGGLRMQASINAAFGRDIGPCRRPWSPSRRARSCCSSSR